MNIFYLDPDPKVAARMHCDKHVVKMCTEYAQMLSTAHRVIDGTHWVGVSPNGRKMETFYLEHPYMNQVLYKVTHKNHPSNIWVRESAENYSWLCQLWWHLCDEYEYRYNNGPHLSWEKLNTLLPLEPMNISKENSFSEPPPAMKKYPHCIVEGDSVQSYHNFYWEDKRPFAKWTRRRKPKWWKEREKVNG